MSYYAEVTATFVFTGIPADTEEEAILILKQMFEKENDIVLRDDEISKVKKEE